jgi:hypothetical protein
LTATIKEQNDQKQYEDEVLGICGAQMFTALQPPQQEQGVVVARREEASACAVLGITIVQRSAAQAA